ncbi:MAG TPA: hypothetical protein VH678_09440 [Xanthobacteraceae bacterium]|jgi:hypothetical protein
MPGGDASIRIKLGTIEVEYQGDASFLKDGLLKTVKELLEFREQYPAVSPAEKVTEAKHHNVRKGGEFDHSTDTIANRLGAKSGPDLAFAAAAHLHFVKGKQKFSRAEIVAEMRTAPGHYKSSYHGNMTASLNRLTSKDRLRLVGGDTYALSNKEREALEATLAQA